MEFPVWLIVFLTTIGVYYLTLHPSVAGGDSGELMCVAHELATPHPPGYPTFAMVTKIGELLFTRLFSISVAVAQNVTHMMLSSFAVMFLYFAAKIETGDDSAAVLASLLFGFSPLVWTYAVTTEVFALNNLFMCAVVMLAAMYSKSVSTEAFSARKNLIILSAFVCGLALTNQHTSVLFVVPIVLWVLLHDLKEILKSYLWLWLLIMVILGMSPYLYLPISSSVVVSTNSWGILNSWTGFAKHFFRTDYGTFSLASKEADYRVSNFWRAWRYQIRDLNEQTLSVMWFLAAVSVFYVVWENISNFRANLKQSKTKLQGGRKNIEAVKATPTVLFLFAVWFFYSCFFNYLSNLPIDQPLFLGVQQRFWIQPLIISMFLVGVGYSRICQSAKLSPALRIAIALLIASLQIGGHFATQDESANYYVRDFGYAILNPLPNNSILLTKGDLMINSARFVQVTEHFRPDVVILDQELLTYDWYNIIASKQFAGRIKFPGAYYYPGRHDTYDMHMFLHENRSPWKRRVFLAYGWKEGDHSVEGLYTIRTFGLSQEVISTAEEQYLLAKEEGSSKREKSTQERYVKELCHVLPLQQHRLPPIGRYAATSWEAVVSNDFHQALVSVGYELLAIAQNAQADKRNTSSIYFTALNCAVRYFEHCLAMFDPASLPTYVRRNLGVALQEMHRYLPSEKEVARKARDAFRLHIDELKQRGEKYTKEELQSLKDAVKYFENLL